MDNTENGQNTNPQRAELREPWRYRLIAYIERKLHERTANKKEESAADRVARRTANATVWIAIFTVVLAVVGGLTLIEVISGGSDTHDLAIAAKSQAELLRQQAVALQQAVIRIQIPEFVVLSPGLQPALQFGLRNEGIAVATKVSFQGTLVWKDEPRHATIGQPVPISIEIPAMPQGDKGARGYVFTIPELTQDALKLIRRSTKARTIEFSGKLSYLNGFDQLMSEDICEDYFAREQSDVGFIDCDQYSAKVKWWSDYEREHEQGREQPN